MHLDESNFTKALKRLRWIVPVLFSAAGLIYVAYESFVHHHHEVPHGQQQVMNGLFFLSVLGPVTTFGILSWILMGTKRLDAANATHQRQIRQLAIVNEVSRLAISSLDPDEVLTRSLEGLLQIINKEIGLIWRRQGDIYKLQKTIGIPAERLVQEQYFPATYNSDVQNLEREMFLALEALHLCREKPDGDCACQGFAFAVGVPIRSKGSVLGVLEVASRSPYQLEPGEQEMLETLGLQIGMALEKAQLNLELAELNEDLERLVEARTEALRLTQDELAKKAKSLQRLLLQERHVEEETRAIIAQDLHDGLRQLIVGTMFESQAIREAVQHSPAAVNRELDQLDNLLIRIEAEMRAAIYSLRPVTLDTLGLVGAIQESVAIFEHSSQISCSLTVVGRERPLSADAELAALRIVQEALNNVYSHAQASQAGLLIHYQPEALEITIYDNGLGFDLQQPEQEKIGSRLGLLGMQERADSVNGQLHIQSMLGKGTFIRLILALESEKAWELSTLSL